MLTPGNWDDRRAVVALVLSTGGGVLLGDQGYSDEETFDRLYDRAQTLRARAVRRRRVRALDGQSGDTAHRKQLLEPMAAVHRSGYARSWSGLWTSLLLKTLHFNMERAGLIAAT